MSESVDIVVIGAGVIGLAIARSLAMRRREPLVLEAEDHFGHHTSSRNSEVIHAGIYYAPGSLKARFCVSGKRMLYRFCEEYAVPYRQCGKLIVATQSDDMPSLGTLQARAEACGVSDLVRLSGKEAEAWEPALACKAALHSPSSGIVDSHALMQSLFGQIERHGGVVVFRSPVARARVLADGFEVEVATHPPVRLHCRALINAAGLWASEIAGRIQGLDPAAIPRTRYAKGSYFTLTKRCPFSRLIYPVPEKHGLGIHLTLDLAGQGRFGPDVTWIDTVDYEFDAANEAQFYSAIRRYWPDLPEGALSTGYTGIRPKLVDENGVAADFRVDTHHEHGVPGLVNLYGIESPGLTSALAIAEFVADSIAPV